MAHLWSLHVVIGPKTLSLQYVNCRICIWRCGLSLVGLLLHKGYPVVVLWGMCIMVGSMYMG